jgi:Na+-driven multidrug efflux pump
MIFSQALAAFVGQNIGAGKQERIKKGLRATFLMSSAVAIAISSLIILSKGVLVGIFNKDPEVIRIGGEYLVIVSLFYIVFTGMFTINGLLRGAGDTLVPMFITLFALWLVRIPAAVFLSKTELQETGIWWAVPIGWAAGLILSFAYYKTGKWKNKAVTKSPVPAKDVNLVERRIVTD